MSQPEIAPGPQPGLPVSYAALLAPASTTVLGSRSVEVWTSTANQEHLAILRQGADVWNAWRLENIGLEPDLQEANLSRTNLSGADLRLSLLRGANLQHAILIRTDFFGADVRRADLQGAELQMADFFEADLRGAHLQETDLIRVDFTEAHLAEADFTKASTGNTSEDGIDLGLVRGLETMQHLGLSTIGIDTLYASGGQIPEVFLRGCGVPDPMIAYARSLVAAEHPIDYFSCFISYADEDRSLAERLYADLQVVRCWFAPHDLQVGEPILSGIDRGIRLYNKLLLILSAASVASTWIEQEVQIALARERTERRRVPFPIRIDERVSAQTAGWLALVWSQRHVGDFCQWKDHDAYQAAFQRVLRDLMTKTNPSPAIP